MKTLYIVRHGKSSWDYQGFDDIDRPLKERGIKDAYKMAKRLKETSEIPGIIISSTANRALHTATIFRRILKIPEDNFYIDASLYAADTDEIMDVLYGIDDDVDSVMIFGHNPGFTELANYLSGLKLDNLPTAGMVILDFETDKWTDISRSNTKREFFDYPKNV